MPFEAVVLITGVCVVFAVFAVAVLYADYQTREFRE